MDQTACPTVSIAMPSFNRGHVIGETIRYVLEQSFQDFELIIQDDGSKDNTTEVVKSFDDPRIQYFTEPNQGPPYPLIKLLEKARGKYIIILHDHDIFHPDLIKKSVQALEKYPEAGFVLQGSAWINEDGVSNYKEMLQDLPELNNGPAHGEKMLMSGSYSSMFHACCMIRRSAFEAVGYYYERSFGLYTDIDLWFRLLQRYDFIYLREVLFKFREREAGGKHFLSGRELDILANLSRIFYANSERFYKSNTSKKLACDRIIKQVYDKSYRTHLLHLAINLKREDFLKAFAAKNDTIRLGFVHQLLNFTFSNSILFNIAAPLIKVLNSARS